jgi:hypothetical protein
MIPYIIPASNETLIINFSDICKCTFNYAYNAPPALIMALCLILITYFYIPYLNRSLKEAKARFTIDITNIVISICCFTLFFASLSNPQKPDYFLFIFTSLMFGIFSGRGYMFGGIMNHYLDKIFRKNKKKESQFLNDRYKN